MKLHYSPSAKAGTNWQSASALSEAPCGQRARGNHSGGVLLGTSLKSAVTCTKCKLTF
ncbi:hypothetical protein SEA_SCHIMMELS22_52 [Microbacterium phage Schimmels22]|nr:hypothetical protein SEA_SCHIMMELS22_52 [Microbacterium phage Schimmels22]